MSFEPLEGAIVPLVTPFENGTDLDLKPLGSLVDFVTREGADALMPTALSGEGPLLDEDETVAVWEEVFTLAAHRLPVIPAIVSFTTRRAVALARRAERLGARAIMVAPLVPELYAGRSERDVIGFYSDVAGATSLPIILFNYPSLTGVDLVPSLVARLAAIDSIRAIKDSTADSRRVHAIRRLLGDGFQVVCGSPNAALESLALGCRAWITGLMNVVPRSARQLLRAVHVARDLELARRVYFEQILPLVDVMAATQNPTGTLKAGLLARGVKVGAPRRPGQPVDPSEQQHIGQIVAKIARAEAATERALAAAD